MARLSSRFFLISLALVSGLTCHASAQTGDPIAAALTQSQPPTAASPVTPAKAPQAAPATPARSFSPQAITDLLKQNPPTPPANGHPANAPAQAVSAPPAASAPAPVSHVALTPDAINGTRFARVNETSRSVDPVVLKAEILLDRAHAPPGVIDGRFGSNFTKAVTTFETVRGLPVDGKLTRRVWDELGGDTAAPVLGVYTIKPEDVAGPFYPDLPSDYALQAKLPSLGYRSAEEMFGERFHMDHKFLRALNPNVDLNVAGSQIIVALIDTMPIVSQIARLDVDKGKGQVLAYDSQGGLIVAYPATIGSEELPSPSGSYVVRGVAMRPTYTYDPKKNFQQGNNTQKLLLPAGPNNPVGAAFIALSKPTFGIHGTPDPTKIDKTHSHGCVRLTNWNAKELASLVKVGTPVNFIEKPGPDQTVGNIDAPVDGIAQALR